MSRCRGAPGQAKKVTIHSPVSNGVCFQPSASILDSGVRLGGRPAFAGWTIVSTGWSGPARWLPIHSAKWRFLVSERRPPRVPIPLSPRTVHPRTVHPRTVHPAHAGTQRGASLNCKPSVLLQKLQIWMTFGFSKGGPLSL